MRAEGNHESASRITVVYYSDAPFYGGAEYYLYLLAAGLPRERFDVHVILPSLDTLEDLRRPLLEAGITLFDPGRPGWSNPRHWISVYRYLRDVRANVFHVNLPGPYDGQEGTIPVVGRIAGVRVVTTEHLPMVHGPWRRVLAKRLTHPFVDLTLTVSDSNVRLLTDLHGIPGGAVRRVYNGIDVSRYQANGDPGPARASLGLGPGEKAVGITGRLAPMKGHRFFLEAARKIHSEIPETRFFIVGDGWLRSSLEDLARELEIDSVVNFLGHRKDIPEILRALDLLVVSSLREGMPFGLLEALAMAKPVVAADVYGLGELVRDGETGRLVPKEDSGAIAGAAIQLLKSPETSDTLGRQARALVEQEFSLAGMIRQTAEIYESLLN
jgi:glycosyltransferase involved in cell wall biosynthesis